MTDTPAPPTDTTDITDVVDKMRESFVTWAVEYAYAMEIATPGLQWVSLPVISALDKALIRYFLNTITRTAVMEAFFLNTAITKSIQARDYVAAVQAKLNLPENCTENEYANAEKAEMVAFRNFVMLTNA